MKAKIEIGNRVNGKNGAGTITRIITKSTGYVEVSFDNGEVRKEMAFNLTNLSGETLKSKPTRKPLTEEQMRRNEISHARFIEKMNHAVLADNFLESQIKSGRYNIDLIQ